MSTTTPTLFRELPLPERMRLAAEVLDEAVTHALTRGPCGGTSFHNHADRLREWADEWDEKEKLVKQLALEMRRADRGLESALSQYREVARILIDAGWTKEKTE